MVAISLLHIAIYHAQVWKFAKVCLFLFEVCVIFHKHEPGMGMHARDPGTLGGEE